MSKESINIDPLEEILKAIGIVHGKQAEDDYRYILYMIISHENKMVAKSMQVCSEDD